MAAIAASKVCEQLDDDRIRRCCEWLQMSPNERSPTATDKVIPGMKRNPFRYQLYVVFWMLERDHSKAHGGILGMDMGYGKVRIVLIIMNSAI